MANKPFPRLWKAFSVQRWPSSAHAQQPSWLCDSVLNKIPFFFWLHHWVRIKLLLNPRIIFCAVRNSCSVGLWDWTVYRPIFPLMSIQRLSWCKPIRNGSLSSGLFRVALHNTTCNAAFPSFVQVLYNFVICILDYCLFESMEGITYRNTAPWGLCRGCRKKIK